MNNNHKILAIVVVLLLIFGWREYSHYSEKKSIEESYTAAMDFKDAENGQLKNSLDLEVADKFIMKQNLMSEKVANDLLKEEIKGYKSISSYLKSEVVTALSNIELQYSDTGDSFVGIKIDKENYIHKDEVLKNFVRTPKNFTHKDEWMSFNGVVGNKSVLLDSLYLLNKFDATIGYKKSEKSFSWIRKKEAVVSLKSYNPYTKIVYVNNVIVDKKKTRVANIMLSKPAMIIYGIVGGSVLLN